MAGNKIIEKIEEEARQNAAAIKASAQKKAEAESARILAKAKASVEEITKKSQTDAAEAAGRLTLVAELQNRKASLASRREVLKEAFDKAADALAHLPKEQWEKLILQIITTSDVTGHEVLYVPAKDRDAYEKGFLDTINKALKDQGKEGKLTLAKEAAPIDGGVFLQGEDCDYDGSFATLLEDVRTEEEYRVAEILYGAEVK